MTQNLLCFNGILTHSLLCQICVPQKQSLLGLYLFSYQCVFSDNIEKDNCPIFFYQDCVKVRRVAQRMLLKRHRPCFTSFLPHSKWLLVTAGASRKIKIHQRFFCIFEIIKNIITPFIVIMLNILRRFLSKCNEDNVCIFREIIIIPLFIIELHVLCVYYLCQFSPYSRYWICFWHCYSAALGPLIYLLQEDQMMTQTSSQKLSAESEGFGIGVKEGLFVA